MLALLLAASIDFERVFPPLATQQEQYRAAMQRLETYRGRVTRDPLAARAAYDAALKAFAMLDSYLYLRTSIDTTDVASQEAYDAVNADFEKRTAFVAGERWSGGLSARRTNNARRAESPPLHLDLASIPADREARAAALLGLARARPNAASEAYARSGLTKREVTRILDAIAAETPRFRAYVAMRAGRASKAAPRYTFDDARAIIPRAVAPLGPAYGAELAALLDPANGRIDSGPGEHRRRGGFSKGFPGFDSVVYMQSWSGTYNDLRVLTHESTHAIQKQLEAKRGVRAVYIDGPKFLSEAYAIVNELLLPEMLARDTTDPAEQQFFLEQFLDSKGISIIFRTAAEAALEQAIYDDAAIRTADDLDALSARVAARYGLAKLDWKEIRLMYEDPFYDVNYAIGGLIALRLHDRVAKLAPLIANGFTAPPGELLRTFTGIDIRDRHFVKDALDAIQPKIDELRDVYRRQP